MSLLRFFFAVTLLISIVAGVVPAASKPLKNPVLFQAGGYNVALASDGATVSASSTVNSSYPASAAINGDRKGLNWGSGGGWNDSTSGQFPDWLEVSFGVNRSIQEIDVFTLQDSYSSPAEPTETMTFTQYGITDFSVQYWDGSNWQSVPGGDVTGNNKVWRKFTFSLINTSKIRVYVTNALSSYSRITEVEAYTPSQPPAVSITSPSNGASFTAPASITISSTATDNDGTISKVEFFQGSTKLGEATTSPYSYSWSGVAAGSYSLTAKATDDSGAYTISSAVSVTVNPALATVTGKVTQSGSGSAIAGAIVKALQGTTVYGSATTNSTGDYSITGLLPGTYSIEATASGYATQTQAGVVLGNGATVTLNFTLGSAISYVYDELGRLIGVIDQNGQAASYSYDAVGNLLGISRYTGSSLAIIGFTPGRGAVGTNVTIYGAAFNTSASQNTVTFNGAAATVVSATVNEIVTSVPAGASTGQIAVNNGTASTTSSTQFVVETNGAPSISSFSPTVVTPGTPVTITGSNFASSANSNNLTFNVVSSAVTTATTTSLTANTPTAGSGPLRVTTPSGAVTSSADLYIVPPPNNASSVDYTGRMSIGEAKTLTISTAEKIGLMLFEGTAGQKIVVQLSNFTVGYAAVRIYQPQGTEIAGANGNLPNWVFDRMTLPVTGTYSVLAASFQYDAIGRRATKTIAVNTTTFLYDDNDIIQELVGGSAAANILTGGVDQFFSRSDSSGTWTPLTDALSSTVALVDSSGSVQTQYTFEPFGNTSVSGGASTNAKEYAGREDDGTSLYYYRARYYSPTLHRFISEDPIGLAGGTNVYAYVRNSPTRLRDPFGLQDDGRDWSKDPAVGPYLQGPVAYQRTPDYYSSTMCVGPGTWGIATAVVIDRYGNYYQAPIAAWAGARTIVGGSVMFGWLNEYLYGPPDPEQLAGFLKQFAVSIGGGCGFGGGYVYSPGSGFAHEVGLTTPGGAVTVTYALDSPLNDYNAPPLGSKTP